MAGSISIRRSIRWLPGEASEPTSTIVLTSPQCQYVDLRILKNGQDISQGIPISFHSTPNKPQLDTCSTCKNKSYHETAADCTLGHNLPISSLDWAIAGTSSSSTRTIDGEQVSHSQWEHWIDSRTSEPEKATDEGDMYPQDDGSTLEKGSMVNPDTGIDTAYEEVWDDEEPRQTTSEQVCVVLRYEDGDGRGLVVRLGRYSQGFFKIGEDVSLERWEWKDSRAVQVVSMGKGEFPCKETLERVYKLGEEVVIGDKKWTVVEVA